MSEQFIDYLYWGVLMFNLIMFFVNLSTGGLWIVSAAGVLVMVFALYMRYAVKD